MFWWMNRKNSKFLLLSLAVLLICAGTISCTEYRAKNQYEKGLTALKIGKNSEALKCYEKILLAEFPNSAEIWKEKDMHHAMWTGNVDDIKKCCKKAIHLNPEDPWMYHYLIMILNDRKRQDEAFGY